MYQILIKSPDVMQHSKLVNIVEHLSSSVDFHVRYELFVLQNLVNMTLKLFWVVCIHVKTELSVRNKPEALEPGPYNLHHAVD